LCVAFDSTPTSLRAIPILWLLVAATFAVGCESCTPAKQDMGGMRGLDNRRGGGLDAASDAGSDVGDAANAAGADGRDTASAAGSDVGDTASAAGSDVGDAASDSDGATCREGALSFDGDDIVLLMGTSGLHLTSAMTIEAWFKTSVAITTESALVGKHVCGYGNGWFSGLNTNQSSASASAQWWVGQESSRIVGSKTLSDGGWHHVAGTWNGTTNRLYVDGVEVGSKSSSYTVTNTESISIGAHSTALRCADQRFKGVIDEVSIWSVVRTAAQIAADQAKPPLGNEPGLEAYFDFNREACGQKLTDRTSAEHHGTLGSSASVGTDDPTWVADGPALPRGSDSNTRGKLQGNL
jgi:hypothetical protein